MPRSAVRHTVVLQDGERRTVRDPPTGPGYPAPAAEPPRTPGTGPTVRVPLGVVCGARSGDKGGDANIGLWARTDAGYGWMRGYLTVDRVRELLGPEVAGLGIEVYALPNLRALNVVVYGLLGDGVASSARPDPQAKGLGEYLRSRLVDVPEELAGSADQRSTGS